MEKLKELLAKECSFQLSDEMMDRFLAPMTEVRLKKKEILSIAGGVDTNIYIVKEGICSYSYMDGQKEITAFFALPGTMMILWHSYYFHLPTFFQIEASCPSVVMKLPKREFDRLVAESHEFAQWALSMAQCQLYFYEMKLAVINGDAKDRFLALVKNRPEIIKKVSLRSIASYLRITQAYLSRLKSRLDIDLKKHRKL